jgi:hypothetical protein
LVIVSLFYRAALTGKTFAKLIANLLHYLPPMVKATTASRITLSKIDNANANPRRKAAGRYATPAQFTQI